MSQKLLSSKCTLVTIIFQCDIGDNYKDRSGWTALLSQQTTDDRRERVQFNEHRNFEKLKTILWCSLGLESDGEFGAW